MADEQRRTSKRAKLGKATRTDEGVEESTPSDSVSGGAEPPSVDDECTKLQGSAADDEGEGSSANEPSWEQEFGSEMAFLLSEDPPLAARQPDSAKTLLQAAKYLPAKIRDLILRQAYRDARYCSCPTPLPSWSRGNPNSTATCGRQQRELISQISIQGVLDRQKERDDVGDNVGYVLARTMRSKLQYEAARQLGCTGAGNQCPRGDCFKRALEMFHGKGMEGIPREVVLALMRDD